MTRRAEPSAPAQEPETINFFRPRPGLLRRKVRLIRLVLAGWALATFAPPVLLVLWQRDPRGAGVLTDVTLFGFPLHFWLTGQLLILVFVLLCLGFNIFVDRLHREGGLEE